MAEPELYYFCRPTSVVEPPVLPVEFAAVTDFLADEPACKMLWELLETQFRTRSKFLAIWRAVSFVAVHRDADGVLDGFLLVSAPVNWQIDYVVVRPDARGQGVGGALVRAAVAEAARRGVPYVMPHQQGGPAAALRGVRLWKWSAKRPRSRSEPSLVLRSLFFVLPPRPTADLGRMHEEQRTKNQGQPTKEVPMCGIIGFTGQSEAAPILLEGLKRLEYRGYDSSGVVTGSGAQLYLRKKAGRIAELARHLNASPAPGTFGISHTRWATHGGATDANAHPHMDASGAIRGGAQRRHRELHGPEAHAPGGRHRPSSPTPTRKCCRTSSRATTKAT